MKRAFLVVVAIVLLLSGCAKKEKVLKKLQEEDLKCAFTASVKDTVVSGNLLLPISGRPEITLTSPSHLSGMKIVVKKDTVSLSHLGMKMDIPINQYPPLSASNTIVSALLDLRRAGAQGLTQTDGGYILCKESALGEYELLLDEQMNPVSLSLPNEDFICEFS